MDISVINDYFKQNAIYNEIENNVNVITVNFLDFLTLFSNREENNKKKIKIKTLRMHQVDKCTTKYDATFGIRFLVEKLY